MFHHFVFSWKAITNVDRSYFLGDHMWYGYARYTGPEYTQQPPFRRLVARPKQIAPHFPRPVETIGGALGPMF